MPCSTPPEQRIVDMASTVNAFASAGPVAKVNCFFAAARAVASALLRRAPRSDMNMDYAVGDLVHELRSCLPDPLREELLAVGVDRPAAVTQTDQPHLRERRCNRHHRRRKAWRARRRCRDLLQRQSLVIGQFVHGPSWEVKG